MVYKAFQIWLSLQFSKSYYVIIFPTSYFCIGPIACIWVHGHSVPLVFPVEVGEYVKVMSHLLHIWFRFVESTIYIEEEKLFELGELEQSIFVVKTQEGKKHC